ncbi:hypothetical protein LY76DRAFT_651134 [Colletotrichum caudatum]|nr:hypothetical protein LY76DRAFT_651134 [Colletotrichum caudatum]
MPLALQQGLCPVHDPRLELPESKGGGFSRLLNSSVPSRKAGGNAEAISFPLPLGCEDMAYSASIMALCKQHSIIASVPRWLCPILTTVDGSGHCSPGRVRPGDEIRDPLRGRNLNKWSLKLKSGFIFGGLATIGTFGGLSHVTELKGKAFDEI